MPLALIAAVSENNVIGRDGGLPWHLSSDLQRFKRLTMGRAIIMGRRTWESIGRPLPGRTSIVVTRQPDWQAKGARTVHHLEAAIEAAACVDVRHDETFIIGGGQLYRAALPRVERIYLARIHATIDGDTTFPTIPWSAWRLLEHTYQGADDRNDFPHTFEVWERPISSATDLLARA